LSRALAPQVRAREIDYFVGSAADHGFDYAVQPAPDLFFREPDASSAEEIAEYKVSTKLAAIT
jgi:hypothetical protein